MSSSTLHVIHFNDVYKMTRFDKIKGKEPPRMNAYGLIDTPSKFDQILAFTDKIQAIKNNDWTKDSRKEPQGLLLFSGDLFSPSVESVLTRGRNMVHLMNELAPDACVTGNHEFDFGRERFDRLIEFSNFIWVLSNVKESPVTIPGQPPDPKASAKTLKGLKEYHIIERAGLKIGVIGLVSQDAWDSINTLSKEGLELQADMAEVCKNLAEKLRNEEKCDLVFALTHAEHNEDVELARRVGAYPANAPMLERSGEMLKFKNQETEQLLNGEKLLEDIPGVDVIFGGHNHDYFLGRGVTPDKRSIGLSDVDKPMFEHDDDLLIVKSGFDFNDLSQVTITIENRPDDKKRKKVITSLEVFRHHIEPQAQNLLQPRSSMACVLERQFEHEVLTGAEDVVAITDLEGKTVFKIDPEANSKGETRIGNWIADSLLNWFIHHEDKAVESRDVVFITTGGSIRGDRDIGPGKVLARDIIQLVSFETQLTLLPVKGEILKAVLNAALEKAGRVNGKLKTGRFPVISGMRVEWSSHDPQPNVNRVDKVYIVNQQGDDIEELDPSKVYRVLTTSYLAQGNSGFDKFKKLKPITSNAQLPMYQVLLYHVNDLKDISIIERAQDLEHKYEAVPAGRRTEEMNGVLEKIKKLKFFLGTSDEFRKDDRWGSLPLAAKYIKDTLFGNSPEAGLPVLDIKSKIDNRMKDTSVPSSE